MKQQFTAFLSFAGRLGYPECGTEFERCRPRCSGSISINFCRRWKFFSSWLLLVAWSCLLTGCQFGGAKSADLLARGAAPEVRTPQSPQSPVLNRRQPKVSEPVEEPEPELTAEEELEELIGSTDGSSNKSPLHHTSGNQSSWDTRRVSLFSSPHKTPFLPEEPEFIATDPSENESDGLFSPPMAQRFGDRTMGSCDESILVADTDTPEFEEHEPFRFLDDAKSFPGVFWEDAKSLVTWQNAVILGAAGAGAVYVRDNWDNRVRYETAEHPLRWGQGSVVLRQFGEYSYQVPILAGVYAASLWTQDPKLHEFSVSTFSAYGLNAIITVSLKGITNTTRPTTQFENGHYGFPSYHASSTFTIAASLDEFYGWKVGVPAYVLAGLVSWSRIDQREHDLSDVLFGAVLGVVVGKTVSAAHLERQLNVKISPYYDVQNQAAGISVEKRF